MTELISARSDVATPSITRRLAIIAAVMLIGFSVAGRTKFFGDADTLWHIAVGRITLHSGLIYEDHFSFTRAGEPWVANQWLAECIMAVADWLGGFDGVFVLTVTVLTVTYLALSYRWIVRGFDPLLTLAFAVLIIAASAYTMNARPHIVSIGLMGFVFALLRDAEDGHSRLTRLLWLIPVFVLWSNLHGAVLGGLGTIVLVAAAWTMQWLLGMKSPISTGRDAGLLWLCVASCGLALLVTPYGIGSLQAWLSIMSMSLPDLIIEHAPLHPGSVPGMLVILLGIVYLIVFAATPHTWSRPTFWLPMVWFVLTWLRIRHAPLFAIIAGIAMAELLPQSRLAPWLVRHKWLQAVSKTSLSQSESVWRFGAVAVRMAAVLLILTAPLLGMAMWLEHVGPLPLIGAGWARPTPRVWPDALIGPLTAFADEHPDGTPVFNEPILGGFLIYNFPRLRTFIDGRCELYGEAFLKNFVAAWREPSNVGRWQQEFGFRAALIEADSPLRRYFDKGDHWRLVAQSPTAVFYRMQDSDVGE